MVQKQPEAPIQYDWAVTPFLWFYTILKIKTSTEVDIWNFHNATKKYK